jgi:hypothetical protein
MTREKALQASNILYKIETYEALAEELTCLSVIEEINQAFGDHIEDEFLAIVQARVDKYTAKLEEL